jgi:hypothetical protein
LEPRASTILSTQLDYRVRSRWTVALEVFNLLDRAASDVDYYYMSRLPGNCSGESPTCHFHPQERSIRLILSAAKGEASSPQLPDSVR